MSSPACNPRRSCHNTFIGYYPFQVGDGGQSVLSAALFRFSRAGRQAVLMNKFEFRRFTLRTKFLSFFGEI